MTDHVEELVEWIEDAKKLVANLHDESKDREIEEAIDAMKATQHRAGKIDDLEEIEDACEEAWRSLARWPQIEDAISEALHFLDDALRRAALEGD